MASYSSIIDHQSMVWDQRRNHAYHAALSAAIQPGSTVLDLGAGLGIHGFQAAELGASRVYMVEPAAIMDITKDLVQESSYSDRIACFKGRIEEVSLPEKVDVIVSVFTGNFLLTEDLLPSLFFARDNWLKPGGIMVPGRGIMEIVPVSAPEYYEQHVELWGNSQHGVDFGSIRKYCSNSVYYDSPEARDAEWLSEPEIVANIDFYSAENARCSATVSFVATTAGVCHGWLGWFKTQLGESWLSTSPLDPPTHWRQVFFPLQEPVILKTGQSISIELRRPQFGDWNWKTTYAGKNQTQSTFLSFPKSLDSMRRQTGSYAPTLNNKGETLIEILKLMNGQASIAEITKHIADRFDTAFLDDEEASRFVKAVVEKYG